MRDELRERGLRLTPQRELVLTAVRALGHATPEDIAEYIHRTHPSINLSTVYRNLETLENVGLVCGKCGSVGEAPIDTAATFVNALADDYGFKTDVTHFAVYGKCSKCSDES
jgi:Fur family ferric uptake transcriptional regulator